MNDDIIKWREEFNTGIHRIDLEHRIFLELMNSFKFALNTERPKGELLRILTEIEKYAVFHFISEENCMSMIDYPELKDHQIHHFELLEQLNLVKYGEHEFSKFYDFLKDWFINHTVSEDMKLKEFVSENNIDINRIRYNISV
ncbi:hemerythrin family protein [Draconibacterium sp. IB214405]|uniref:bacteriohemerythrin n=1 Tax=Draconibacterium sp. IB214405 TaxID=3097352 RepID=UPI002A134620|nr:hemerythrin family protein [Draconibacterium sp. IB214405]MDX8340426.1 hemerythrin family protein [Draconibacterium sp. IB214405]